MANRVVWVSGASSGLGMHTAQALLASGWQVVSGARSFLTEEGPGSQGHRLHLDVADPNSVVRFCEQAKALFGPPDALVCAAGVLTFGPAESYTDSELKQVWEVNFLGAVRLIRETLPLMREKGQGRILCLSSVNGLLATPFQGAYVASKHALEGYLETLALETQAHNIQVCIVEPGDHQGGSQAYRQQNERAHPAYQQAFENGVAAIHRDEAKGGDPQVFGQKMARLLTKKRLPLRKKVVRLDEWLAILTHDLLPWRLYAAMIRKHYKV